MRSPIDASRRGAACVSLRQRAAGPAAERRGRVPRPRPRRGRRGGRRGGAPVDARRAGRRPDRCAPRQGRRRVKAGQVLVQIDARSAVQAEAASQSQVREAQANLANAKAKYERSQRLFAQKFISQAALDQAEAEYLAAQAQTAAAIANAGQVGDVEELHDDRRALRRRGRLDRGRSGRHGDDRGGRSSPCSIRASCASPQRCRRRCSRRRSSTRRSASRSRRSDARSSRRRVTVHPGGRCAHAHHARAPRPAGSDGAACRASTRGHCSSTGRTRALAIPRVGGAAARAK